MSSSERAAIANASISALSASLEEIDSATLCLEDCAAEDVTDNLLPIEDAKLNVSLAYSAASLFYMLQNVEGKDGTTHQIYTSELSEIRSYVSKLKKIEADAKTKSTNENEKV